MTRERCPNCAALVDDDERYCHNCGIVLKETKPVRQSVSRQLLESYDARVQEDKDGEKNESSPTPSADPGITSKLALVGRFVCPECGATLEDHDTHDCSVCGMKVTPQMRKPDPFLDPQSVREVLTEADEPESHTAPVPAEEQKTKRSVSSSALLITAGIVAVVVFGAASRCSGAV